MDRESLIREIDETIRALEEKKNFAENLENLCSEAISVFAVLRAKALRARSEDEVREIEKKYVNEYLFYSSKLAKLLHI